MVKLSYNELPCSEGNIEQVNRDVSDKISRLDCVTLNMCSVQVENKSCGGSKKKRSTSTLLEVKISTKFDSEGSDLNLVNVFENETGKNNKTHLFTSF